MPRRARAPRNASLRPLGAGRLADKAGGVEGRARRTAANAAGHDRVAMTWHGPHAPREARGLRPGGDSAPAMFPARGPLKHKGTRGFKVDAKETPRHGGRRGSDRCGRSHRGGGGSRATSAGVTHCRRPGPQGDATLPGMMREAEEGWLSRNASGVRPRTERKVCRTLKTKRNKTKPGG